MEKFINVFIGVFVFATLYLTIYFVNRTPKKLSKPFNKQNTQTSDPEIINKPWGYEKIWAKTDKYIGKILHINAGESLSLQYHKIKDETIMVLSGTLELYVAEYTIDSRHPAMGFFCFRNEKTLTLNPGDHYHIKPEMIHQMKAPYQDVEVVEVSTPELYDVVRLKDKYGRT